MSANIPQPVAEEESDILFHIRLVTAFLISWGGPMLRRAPELPAPIRAGDTPTDPENDLPPAKIGNWDPCFKAGPCPCSSPCEWVEPLVLPGGLP